MTSGYDFSHKNPFRLMQGRLGVYEKYPVDLSQTMLEGVRDQAIHASVKGGFTQQERMIKDKRRSLERAILYSYQGAKIVRESATDKTPYGALITPDKLKMDYDNKIISIGYEYNLQIGDVFEWIGTNSHWLVCLQDMTELAYFRGEIRRCSHQISWTDPKTKKTKNSYVALKGPKQQDISTIHKHGIAVDQPNYSLTMIIPQNKDTLEYFVRYRKFYLQGHSTCWRVEAVNPFDSPGLLTVSAVEDYANKHEDNIEDGIVGELIPEKIPEVSTEIQGKSFIKVKETNTFSVNTQEKYEWIYNEHYPIQVLQKDDFSITLKWDSLYSGQFDLAYGPYSKTIVVESMF